MATTLAQLQGSARTPLRWVINIKWIRHLNQFIYTEYLSLQFERSCLQPNKPSSGQHTMNNILLPSLNTHC